MNRFVIVLKNCLLSSFCSIGKLVFKVLVRLSMILLW